MMTTLLALSAVHFGVFVHGSGPHRWYCPQGWVCREVYDPAPKHTTGATPRVCTLPKLDCSPKMRMKP